MHAGDRTVKNQEGCSSKNEECQWEVPLNFPHSGIADLGDQDKVNATLEFTGNSRGVIATADYVTIKGTVSGTPSLEHSSIHIPKSAMKGERVVIKIKTVDVNGLQILEANGRFFTLQVCDETGTKQSLTTTFEKNDEGATFQCVFQPTERLRCTGKYTVWISKAFQYDVKSGLGKLALPTVDHPMTFIITEEDGSMVRVIAGALIGLLAIAALAGIGFYFYKNPKKFKSLIVSMYACQSFCACFHVPWQAAQRSEPRNLDR